MDYTDYYNATKHAFIDAIQQMKTKPQMMRIDSFDAEDDGGEPVKVIGVIDDDDVMRFVVIEEGPDGEIYPIARTTIYRKGTASAAVS